MSYREKPLLRLYDNSFHQIAIIDDYEDASFERNIYSAGQFTITINRNIPNAMYFEKGIFVQFGNDPYDFGEINDVTKNVDESGKGGETLSITGYDSRYILKRRIIKNMNDNGKWSMTSTGEICLRSIIRDQCGANAEAKRRLPIFNAIPDGQDSVGQMYSVSEEYNNLYDVCVEIATQSETGWRLKFDNGSLTMECYSGLDLTNEVNFGTKFNSMRDGQLVDSFDSFTNAVYVGGKGQNDDRDIYEGENAIGGNPPSGLDRFECWDDQSGMTVQSEYEAEAMSMLSQYGQTLTLNGNGLAKCPYIYKEQYDVGDTVSMEMDGKKFHTKILAVTEHWTKGNYDLNFSFGKSVSTLSSQLHLMLRQIQKASNKDTSTDSVRWYTIPTDTEMPKSDVTFRTIGFIGNVGGGATFKLYLDNEKTGAKTYHIYFKQLGGSGKLTLTTGVAGASNLTMNVGSYVMIVYVDEFGNVSMQGSGTTNTVQSGNTQPVTSDAVSTAIDNVSTEINNLVKGATWIPYNGMNPLTQNIGFYAYSVNPSLMISQGVPNSMSEHATIFGCNLTNYKLLLYIDVFGSVAVWNTNTGKWRKLAIEF